MGDIQPLLVLATSSHPKGTPITSELSPSTPVPSPEGSVIQAQPCCLHCTRPPSVQTKVHGHHCEVPRECRGGSWVARWDREEGREGR